MHPEMIRAIAVLQMADREAQAQAGRRVRVARQARRERRRNGVPDLLAGIRVPDYVDGTFSRGGRPAGHTSGPGSAGSPAPAPAGGRGMTAGRDAA